MLGDGLVALTSACESRLALDQIMTEPLPLYVPLIISLSTLRIKMFRTPPPSITLSVSVNPRERSDPVLIFPFKSSDMM